MLQLHRGSARILGLPENSGSSKTETLEQGNRRTQAIRMSVGVWA